MDGNHKTTAGEFREWRDGAVAAGGFARPKKPSRRKLTDEEMAELWDDEIPFGGPGDRESNSLPKLPDAEFQALDRMIESHGLKRVLRTLRELCESRVPSEFDTSITFGDLDEKAHWQENADVIENSIREIVE